MCVEMSAVSLRMGASGECASFGFIAVGNFHQGVGHV